MYIWNQKEWPILRHDIGRLSVPLAETRFELGRLLGRMESLGFQLKQEATLRLMTEEVVKTSEIEGEHLDVAQVRSSLARRLGLDIGGLVPSDRHVDGIVEVMLDATQGFEKPLTRERLLSWHRALFPTGKSGLREIVSGRWRDDRKGPMQVVSGPEGRARIHYEAPPADRIEGEIEAFLRWFHEDDGQDGILRSGIAHFWFVTIHPFEDGNGRMSRAVAEMSLARAEGSAQRFYSVSSQIRQERAAYYEILEKSQRDSVDITEWLDWYLGCVLRAVRRSEDTLGSVMMKARFWERFGTEPLTGRQIKVLDRLLGGFEGKLTTSKWARLADCSQDTAYRDILDLVERGILKKNPGGGRSSSYSLIRP